MSVIVLRKEQLDNVDGVGGLRQCREEGLAGQARIV
jgi:hypothetical protein